MVQVEENADLDVGGSIKGRVVGGKVSGSGCECGGSMRCIHLVELGLGQPVW